MKPSVFVTSVFCSMCKYPLFHYHEGIMVCMACDMFEAAFDRIVGEDARRRYLKRRKRFFRENRG